MNTLLLDGLVRLELAKIPYGDFIVGEKRAPATLTDAIPLNPPYQACERITEVYATAHKSL
jgi:hypothetical protein